MVELKAEIERRRLALAQEPFLQGLEASSSLEEVRRFVPQLHFFVYSFQDMLRLSHELMEDPELREIARKAREGDAGHEQWFAFDVAALDCERDVRWILGPEHRVTRDVSYALLSELLHASDDRVRMVFPLVLEASASVFFFRVIDLIERAGFKGELRYFARHHQQVESEHDFYTESTSEALDAISYEPAAYEAALTLVRRSFDHLTRFAAHLEAHRAGRGEARQP
jgi:hypothetical protein